VTGIVPLALAAVAAVSLAVVLFVVLAPREPVPADAAAELDAEPLDLDELPAPRPAARAPRAVLANALRAALQATVGRKLDRSNRGTRLAVELARADLKLKPAEWLLMTAGVSALVGLLAAVRFGSLIALPFGAAAAYVASRVMLKLRQSKRRKRFEDQLAPTLLAVGNGLKAGYAFGQALDLASKNAVEPMASELSRAVREVTLGIPIGEALSRMVVRNQSEDLRLVMTAVQIHAQVGGNLAQILDNIEYTIRERIRIKGEIKTLTSQARASGWILMILPFALAGLMTAVAPSYFNPMLSEAPGRIMLGVAGLMLLGGYAVIRKIVNVKV
jgi:tight adherence protein B